MKKVIIWIFALLLFSPRLSSAAVIFSENYDNIQSGWTCSNSIPAGWTDVSSCPSPSSYGGVTHYACEITSGGRTGNSLKLWRRNGIWTEYVGYLNKDFTAQEFNARYKELYVRWYVKIPTGWDASLGNASTHKLNRFYVSSLAGGKDQEWYMDVKGPTFKTGYFSFYYSGGQGVWYTSKTISQLGINDGQWHSLEWHVKLNSSTGSSDGGWNFYIDGVEQTICDGVGENCSVGIRSKNMGATTNQYFTSALPPAIGNLSGGTWRFPTSGWYAIEFDDYIVSTTYIGPDGSPTPIPAPTPTPQQGTILFENWENNSVSNWDDDYIAGDTRIATTPVYAGAYAIKMQSSNPRNYVHFFGDHPGVNESAVTDVAVEEYYYPSPNFIWPSSDMKLWIMNCFESWNAAYNTAGGQAKPHTWAPYYMTISVNSSGQPFGQLTRADGLGGTGTLWQNLWQNVGSAVSLIPGQWNKMKYRLKLNDLGQNNGVFQLWVNDALKCDYSNINFRGNYTAYSWNHLIMSMHANPSHPQSQWIARDNITVSSGVVIPSPSPTPPSAPTGLRITQ